MMPKLYVETTIFGYLTGRTSRDVVTAGHQKTTRLWWNRRRREFDLYYSELVLEEISAGDEKEAEQRRSHLRGITLLAFSPQAVGLARALLKRKALLAKAETTRFMCRSLPSTAWSFS
jgi:hypothetical protein